MHPSALGMPLGAERRRWRQRDRRRCACPHRGTVLWKSGPWRTVLRETMLADLRREPGPDLPPLSRTSRPMPEVQRSTRVRELVRERVQVPVPVQVQVPVQVPARVQARAPVQVQANPHGRHICRSPRRPT